MFDLRDDTGSVKIKRRVPGDPIPTAQRDPHTDMLTPDRTKGAKKPKGQNVNLDSPEMDELHRQMLACYSDELDRQSENRAQMAEDEDFYDNIQWSPEDAAVLEDRGQVALVYNVVSTTCDWITGSQKRARTDFKVLPRRKEEGKSAEKKTALLKYLSDVNREEFAVSRAFEDAVKVGIGWLDDGLDADSEDEPLYTRYESWRNVLHDTAATQLDVEDGRYIFRSKWVDLDVAIAMFKDREDVLRQAAMSSDDFMQMDEYGDAPMDSQENALDQTGASTSSRERVLAGYDRQRVRIIEAWFKRPIMVGKMRGGNFSGEIFDAFSQDHKREIATGEAELTEKSTMRIHVGLFTEAGMLWFSESPYRHNRFPMTPVWGYRRGRDGAPYGVIRRLKDIQVDINKRASKALHILSTSKIIMDYDALPDDMTMEEFMEEASRPDAVIRKKPGSDLIINAERELSQWHLELMSRSIAMVQQASGVTDELMGRRTNATSGVAIQRRQDQGSLATAKLFDNLLFASQVHGEKLLANTEQFMTEEKQFRITNMRGRPEYITINDGLPENSITRCKADYIISESAWHASSRQAAADELLETMTRMPPETAIMILDLVVENMDLPNREEIVRRIRTVTGMRDPDADEPTPEELARAQEQAELKEIQKRTLVAQLEKLIGEAAKAMAAADASKAAIQKTAADIVGVNITAQQGALDVAGQALALPAATKVADFILKESGFVSQSDKDAAALATLEAAAAQEQDAAAQQQAAAMQQQPGIEQQQPGGAPPPAGPAPMGIQGG